MHPKATILEVISEGTGGGAKHVYDLVKCLREAYAFIVACPDNGPYYRKFKDLGVDVCNLPLQVASPGSLPRLLELIKRGSVDLVHVHGRKAGFYGRLACFLTKKPVIYSIHGLHFQKHRGLLRQLCYRIEQVLNRHTTKVINVSYSEHRECLDLGLVLPANSLVVCNGIESAAFDGVEVDVEQKRAEFGLEPGDFVVGHIAKFDVQKGHDFLVAASALIMRQHRRVKFLFIGDGQLRPAIERRVADLGIGGQTVFTGFREDIPELLYAVDVVVLPSRWEGLPLVLLEAMACGKPIVATRVTGNVDVVVDGVTGFLVPIGDVQALADKIIQLQENAALRAAFGRQGRERVERHFSLGQMVAQTRAVYAEVLAQRPWHVGREQ
jgi:glycosyltransferase involved in cell wall biosynthesis